MEPLKTKDPEEVLAAMKKCFKRNYVKEPEASLRTDGGTEFQGVFHKYLYHENILHKVALAGRHNQLANIENLNRTIGRLLNGYMNAEKIATNMPSRKWLEALKPIRVKLNKYRAKKMPENVSDVDIPPFEPFKKVQIANTKKFKYLMKTPKFKVGQFVYYISPVPLTALGKKQPTANFRMGDRQWSKQSYPIKQVLAYSNPSQYRYLLGGMTKVSFTEHKLMKDTNN